MIITKTPFRMSFFGGGTDMESFFKENGGAVLSTTFDKYCYVNVRHLPRFFDYSTELSYSKTERVTNIDDIQHPAIRNAMKMLDMHEIRLTYEADLPARSGLGTSSSFAVGMLNAFYALKGKYADKKKLADEAIYLERNLCQEAGGWQDQIAASFGGFKGEKVLFSGTPCQVDGLKRFLGKYNEQDLMLIALVCHGVSSPVAFARYLQEVEKENNSSVLGVRFRDKRISNGTLSHRFTTLTLKDGREISSTDDLYTAAFGIGVMDRESCYCCPYASPSGAGDVTIGDFWGIEKTVPHLSSEISKGISLIIPHTEKAVNLMTELSEFMLLEKIPLKSAVNDRQRQLQMPIERPKMRDTFLRSVLVEHRKFKREAQNAVLVWKINGYKKRVVNKLNKVFGRNKVKS